MTPERRAELRQWSYDKPYLTEVLDELDAAEARVRELEGQRSQFTMTAMQKNIDEWKARAEMAEARADGLNERAVGLIAERDEARRERDALVRGLRRLADLHLRDRAAAQVALVAFWEAVVGAGTPDALLRALGSPAGKGE